MALRPLLRFENPDSTRDMNDQSRVYNKGVFEGGRLSPVTGSLQVRLTQFATVGPDGMFVREDEDENIFSVVEDERNYIVLRQRYIDNADPVVSLESLVESDYLGDPELEYLVLFGVVTVPSGAIEVEQSDIDYGGDQITGDGARDVVDPLGRLTSRGRLNDTGSLPEASATESNINRPGDFYIITDGSGDFPEIWVWNGVDWKNVTQAQAMISLLSDHLDNLTDNRKHLTNLQFEAVNGTTGTPSDSNRYVTSLDARIPTQDENDAMQPDNSNLSGGVTPSDTNRYIAASKIFAIPTELSLSGGAPLQIVNQGKVYVGSGGAASSQVYFNLFMEDPADEDSDKELLNSQFRACRVTRVHVDDASLTTNELNPSTNSNVDSLGFFDTDAASLFLAVSDDDVTAQADVDFRIAYAKRTELGDLLPAAFIERGPKFGQVDHRVHQLLSANINAQFADAIWDGSLEPGEVAGFSGGQFVEHDNGASIFPVGLRGNSNNLIMEGLYTFDAPTGFGAGDEVYASDVTNGALTTSVNERFIGTFISDTELLVNMNAIGISSSTFVPGTSFPASMFDGGLSPGEAAAYNDATGDFEQWDFNDSTTPAPLGIRGDSNNIIQNGLYTAGGAPYVSGIPVYASIVADGQLTSTENDFQIGFTLSTNELFVNVLGQQNWISAREAFAAEHNDVTGVHNEGSSRTFVGLAAEAGAATSGSLASSTGMTLFATDTGQVFHCTDGSADTWIEASQFSGPLEITNSLEVGGNLILGNQTLDDGGGDTMNPFAHAVRHLAGGDDPLSGVIGQIFTDTDTGSQALLSPLANLSAHSSVGFDFSGRSGNSTIIWYWVGNVDNSSGSNRWTEARTYLDPTTTGVFVELGSPYTAQINYVFMGNNQPTQITIVGTHNAVSAASHTLEIRAASTGASTTTEDRILMMLDLGPN